MHVFKFGGASVNSADRIRQVSRILATYSDQSLLVVVSAMGKTTNALEKVVAAFHAGQKDEALELFARIKDDHISICNELLQDGRGRERLLDLFTEVEWVLHDKPLREYDYYYDQIVSVGELLSTTIVHAYLHREGVPSEWVDVRDVLRTDSNYRDATVDLKMSRTAAEWRIRPLLDRGRVVITQGFIGATAENESTTLGREGSDYTAAIFCNLLNADDLTIWKDVAGVMNADPKLVPEATVIRKLSYAEVIEMAYYGAQVIHPKTIKPLQNKQIPLFVRCFLDPDLPGTVIHDKAVQGLPPIIVWKMGQSLLHLRSRDFSFVGEYAVGRLYERLEASHVRPNLVQTGAISILLAVDDKGDKTERLASEAAALFDVQVETGLTLLTVRHGDEALVRQLTDGYVRVLRQETPETVQVLLRK